MTFSRFFEDEQAIQLIALRQPKARDFRFITMTMRIASELERIGDQAVNIAHRAGDLNKEPLLKPLVDIPRMAETAQDMIRKALEAPPPYSRDPWLGSPSQSKRAPYRRLRRLTRSS